MSFISKSLAAVAALALSAGISLAETPVLKAAVLKFGTVNWELDTIQHHGLDRANGFALEVQGMAGGPASKIAFQGGEVDMFVSDWLWVARQRAAGKDYVFIPYSKAVGGLMVGKDSGVAALGDLAGQKIAIAGGPLDKSWLILQAYAEANGVDLAGQTEQVFGAPPLVFKMGLSGETAATINFWHFTAKAEAAGMRKLIDVSSAAASLGLDPETPLLGYVVRGEMLRDQPEIVHGLARASRQAKEMLAADDAEWERLRPRMNAKTDAQFAFLVDGFRKGIPAAGPVDEAAADSMLQFMAKQGGGDLVGDATTLPDGVFLTPGS